MSLTKQKKAIFNLLESLDISDEMQSKAEKSYQKLSEYLISKGLPISIIYPQGSFAIGTVIKPKRTEEDDTFDLDVICLFDFDKLQKLPSEINRQLREALEANDDYKKILTINDECFTLSFTGNFNMDLLPATKETLEAIEEYKKSANANSSYFDDAIAIAGKASLNYKWILNNPKGYKNWFLNINQNYKACFMESKIAASIEDLPIYSRKTPLQKVIQLLKLHRNKYYENLNRIREKKGLKSINKPISALISTLVAYIAQDKANLDLFDLLYIVIDNLSIYSKYQVVNENQFRASYPNFELIKRINGQWILQNPVHPKDNLVDSWNENQESSKYFFEWLLRVRIDIQNLLEEADEKTFYSYLNESLGKNYNIVPTVIYKPMPINYRGQKPWLNQ